MRISRFSFTHDLDLSHALDIFEARTEVACPPISVKTSRKGREDDTTICMTGVAVGVELLHDGRLGGLQPIGNDAIHLVANFLGADVAVFVERTSPPPWTCPRWKWL